MKLPDMSELENLLYLYYHTATIYYNAFAAIYNNFAPVILVY